MLKSLLWSKGSYTNPAGLGKGVARAINVQDSGEGSAGLQGGIAGGPGYTEALGLGREGGRGFRFKGSS